MNGVEFGAVTGPASGASTAGAWWRDPWVAGGAAILTVSLVPALAVHASPGRLLAQLGLAVWFVVPGWLMVRWLAGTARPGVHGTLAPAWGYLLSSVVLLLLWLGGWRGLEGVLLAPMGAAGLAWGLARLARGRVAHPAWTRADTRAILLLLPLVPLVVGWPYARVGAPVPDGQVYRAYFTADFVWIMSVVAELAKGTTLPVNPFRAGSAMHYYWLPHLFPAVEHRVFGGSPVLPHLLLVNSVLAGLAFVGFLYGLARHFTRKAWAAACGAAVAVLATSFEGLEQLVTLWSWGQPLSLVSYVNIDAVTRWIYGGLPVDGLQRLLLYQPHHQLGYATAFSSLLLAASARRAADWRLAALCGALLGGSLLLSTFSALMLTVIVALYLGLRVLRERAWGAAVPMALAAALPLVGAVVATRWLSYVELGTPPITLGVNPLARHAVLQTVGLGMGPFLLALAAGGAVLVATRRRRLAAMVGAVVAVCALFYVFVDVRDHQNVYVAWRVGHVLFILMAGLAACVLGAAGRARGAVGWLAVGLVGVVVAAALPTTVIDLYNTQDITNFEQAPGFRWTLLLGHDELAALEWVRTTTAPDAVVQVDPVPRDPETWAYIPAFAERRMAAGLPISMIPLSGYQRATERVERVFRAESALDAAIECRRSEIDYLWLGEPEQRRHPQLKGVLDAAPALFEKVFDTPGVTVYHFRDARHGARPAGAPGVH